MPVAMTAKPAITPTIRPKAAPRGKPGARLTGRRKRTRPAPRTMIAAMNGKKPLSGPDGPNKPIRHAAAAAAAPSNIQNALSARSSMDPISPSAPLVRNTGGSRRHRGSFSEYRALAVRPEGADHGATPPEFYGSRTAIVAPVVPP